MSRITSKFEASEWKPKPELPAALLETWWETSRQITSCCCQTTDLNITLFSFRGSTFWINVKFTASENFCNFFMFFHLSQWKLFNWLMFPSAPPLVVLGRSDGSAPNVGGHDDHGVGKGDHPTLGIGQPGRLTEHQFGAKPQQKGDQKKLWQIHTNPLEDLEDVDMF